MLAHLSIAREERDAADAARGVVDPNVPIEVDADGDPVSHMSLGVDRQTLDRLPYLDTEPAGLARDPRTDDLDDLDDE